MATAKNKQANASTFCMGKFTTSKLTKNLSNKNKVCKFEGYSRIAQGRG